MSCEDFQRLAGARPFALGWRERLHFLACRACAFDLMEMRALDLTIARALELLPAGCRIAPVGGAARPARI